MTAKINYFEINQEQKDIDYTGEGFEQSGLCFNKESTEWLLVDKSNKIVLGLGYGNSSHNQGHLFDVIEEPDEVQPEKVKEGYVSESFALKMLALTKSEKIQVEPLEI